VPLHRQQALQGICVNKALPVAESCAARVLSLPMYPELKEEQIDRICDVVLGVLEG
jgi:dTDP-4-amino-4,6-dideoxygalactose transaminase